MKIISSGRINRPLVSIKLSLFCWFGALSSAQVYMTIYLKSFGISAQTAAFVTAVFPLSRIIGPCISGPVADKIGKYKPILYICFVVQILMAVGFLGLHYVHGKDRGTNVSPLCRQQIVCCLNGAGAPTFENESLIDKYCYRCIHECSGHEVSHKNSSCLCKLQVNSTTERLGSLGNYSCGTTNVTCFSSVNGSLNSTSDDDVTKKSHIVLLTTYTIYQVSLAITYAMEDTTTLAMVKYHDGAYGNQRVWAIVGMSIFSPISGILIDYASAKEGEADYSPAFYLFNALTIVNIIAVAFMDLKHIPPSKNLMKDLRKQFGCRMFLFLSSLMFHGVYNGLIESFFFWYLQSMGSPNYLMGLNYTFIGICAIPLSHVSKSLIDKFGCASLIVASFFVTSGCYFAFSFLSNPWLLVLISIPHSAFYHLMWIAAATLSSKIVPDNLLASIQSTMIMSHFGLGRTAGTLIGGNLIYAYGESLTFLYMGISATVISVAYTVLFCCNKTQWNWEAKHITSDLQRSDSIELKCP